MKLLETVKYVETATKSMKNFYEKTKYNKVSELLVVLHSSFDVKLKQVKVFQNKYAQIEETKATFMASLVKIIVSNLEDKLTENFEKLEEFFETIENDSCSFFLLEFLSQDIDNIKNLVREFSKFGNFLDLFELFLSSTKEIMRRHHKQLLNNISVKIFFRKPNLRLLEGYKKLLKVNFLTY